MQQTWANLLFLHWRFPAELVQATLPPGLTVDTFEGTAWLGVVPFFMRDVRPRWLPAVPGWSNFLELNVRTYVFDRAGRPGVWFYSLDCNRIMAVNLARKFYHLPYEHARMSAHQEEHRIFNYTATRRGYNEEARYTYATASGGTTVAPESREFFLIERYLLFAYDPRGKQLWSGQVCHPPYRVAREEASVWSDVPLRQAGFAPGGRRPDHQCVAAPVAVRIFGLQAVS
jgi:uncharacterized protein YqjF (DUF2071 family)